MDNKILFGIMCILFNGIGVPSFMQGKTKTGIIRLVLAVIPVVGQVMGTINGIMGIILGIKVLTMSDEDYAAQKMELDMGIPKAKEE